MPDSLRTMFEAQKKFSDIFFDGPNLTPEEREEKTRQFTLALHAEVSSLVQGINFKEHREKVNVSSDVLLYEGVDVMRYMMAILNLWGFTPERFAEAFWRKDHFLNLRHSLTHRVWNGEPVIIVDIDDVLAGFREGYTSWLAKLGIQVDANSTEYYYARELKEVGISPHDSFLKFVSEGHMANLDKIQANIEVVNKLHDAGYWIHLLTARPEGNLTCLYDTYYWLANSGLKFDKVSFSPEKFIWLSQTDYYSQHKVVCAIDDSEKHIMEYSKHGVKVYGPSCSYNQRVLTYSLENVTLFTDPGVILTDLLGETQDD